MSELSGLRVGYVVKRFPRFSETFILNELLALQKAGASIHVFSLLAPSDEPRHGALEQFSGRVIYLPGQSSLKRLRFGTAQGDRTVVELLIDAPCEFGGIWVGKRPIQVATLQLQAAALAMLGRQFSLTHLHAHFASDPTTVAMLASRLSDIPYSFTAHAKDIYHCYTTPEQDRAARRIKIARSRFVATVTDANRTHLCKISPESTHKIRRVYNGIDLDRFRASLGGPVPDETQPPLILGVGRLVEKKGFQYLIQACSILIERGILFRCQIIGDGPLATKLARQIRDAGLTEHVQLVPQQPQEQLVGAIREASLSILPCIVTDSGDRDALPTVLLESMAVGVPVVTTRVNGCPEIVGDGVAGELVQSRNAHELADAIGRLLSNAARRKSLGRQGRARCEALFDLHRNARDLASGFATCPAQLEIGVPE